MNRRKFLQSTAALFCAPAIVKAENIMRIAEPKIILPEKKLLGAVDVFVGDFHTARIIDTSPPDSDHIRKRLIVDYNNQVFSKEAIVSHQKVIEAGSLKNEIELQMARKMREMERDIELVMRHART